MVENSPEFWRSWQALMLASTTMHESQMLSSLYAYQAFLYCFNDYDLVTEAVMPDSVGGTTYYTPSERYDIYHDSYYGMDTIRKLITWVTAADGLNEEGSLQNDVQKQLLSHFESSGMTE